MVINKQVIGVDLDNTIISYDRILFSTAVEKGFLEKDVLCPDNQNKKNIRDTIRLLDDGEVKWQRLQALIYGSLIDHAELIEGVGDFFHKCREKEITTFIVSHKTRFSNFESDGTDLRKAALGWMEKNAFFEEAGLGIKKESVYFESTREEKIERIKALGCTHFIDDLIETFQEKSFPGNIEKILYSQGAASKAGGDKNKVNNAIRTFASWKGINGFFFG